MAEQNLTARRSRRSRRPDGIYERHNSDGSVSFIAQVRLKGFKAVAKAFSTREAARSWREELERELHTQRERGEVRGDLSALTVKGLAEEYLADRRPSNSSTTGSCSSCSAGGSTITARSVCSVSAR